MLGDGDGDVLMLDVSDGDSHSSDGWGVLDGKQLCAKSVSDAKAVGTVPLNRLYIA
jgi:hypothetical protein